MPNPDRSRRIRDLNDAARASLGIGCRLAVTPGVEALPSETQSLLRDMVEAYSAFSEDNDPYNEHDFGRIDLDGLTILWKIDYLDLQLKYHSEDPADPTKTIRLLTLMLASEY